MDRKTDALLVSVETLSRVWPDVEPLLAPALDRQDCYTGEDVLYKLLTQQFQLWIAIDDENVIHAAMVTAFMQYPRKRSLFIVLLGGNGFDDWGEHLDYIEQWAKAAGCKDIQFQGRKGWMRKRQDFRYEVLATKEIGG